jgi:hypothetical protein
MTMSISWAIPIELILEAQRQFVFEARIPDNPASRKATALEIGSRMDLEGIYKVQMDSSRTPRALVLLLRDASDISHVTLPPIPWTPRLWKAFGLCALALAASMLWLLSLRRRIRRQTEIIQQQLERKAALERRHGQLVENANDLIFTVDATQPEPGAGAACERRQGRRENAAGMTAFLRGACPGTRERLRAGRRARTAWTRTPGPECWERRA